jgi:predicted nucleic acid-binding Zn ribbon protein
MGARRPERSDEAHPLSAVIGSLAQERVLAAGLALGRLAARWSDVVGERLAAETAPLRLDRGTLVVAVSTQAWAAQVGFLAAEIAARASTDGAPVRELRVVVDASSTPSKGGRPG